MLLNSNGRSSGSKWDHLFAAGVGRLRKPAARERAGTTEIAEEQIDEGSTRQLAIETRS